MNKGEIEIFEAIKAQNITRIQALVDEGVDVNLRDYRQSTALIDKGRTPLILAAREAGKDKKRESVYCKIAEVLIKAGAEVDGVGDYGFTPLMCVGWSCRFAQLLVDCGANVNAEGKFGETALSGAAMNGDIARANLLIRAGADVNARGLLYLTPLVHVAREIGGLGDTDNGKNYLKMADLLLRKGADVNLTGNDGSTALHHAAKRGRLSLVRRFINAGADLRLKGGDNKTALELSESNGHMHVVAYLRTHGAS